MRAFTGRDGEACRERGVAFRMRRLCLVGKRQERRLGGGTGGMDGGIDGDGDGEGDGMYEEGGGSGGKSESSISTIGREFARELMRAAVKSKEVR